MGDERGLQCEEVRDFIRRRTWDIGTTDGLIERTIEFYSNIRNS
jgi:hypothetical protein